VAEMDDDAKAVHLANLAFYRAFRGRSYTAMEAIWAKRAPVACIHPGMDVISGRVEVLKSWRGILAHEGSPQLVCDRVEIQVLGDIAYATCLEGTSGDAPALVATNIYVREDETWRLLLHQAGPLSRKNRFDPLPNPPDPAKWN
jgi:ketosteroid isomerase-like protein